MEFPKKIYVFDNPVLDFSLLGVNRNESDVEYIRKDCVEHIISSAKGPQDALNKLRSL